MQQKISNMASPRWSSCRRVLMTADTVGGVWTYALELTRALAAYDIEVDLAVMGPSLSRAQREEALRLDNLNLFKSEYKLEWMQDCWRDVRSAGDWLLSLANRLNPDLVHLNGYVHASLDWQRPVLVVGHSCVLSWWRAVKGEATTEEWQRYKAEVTRGLRNADTVVTPSAAMSHALREHYDLKPDIEVIHNGRDAELFVPANKRRFILAAGRVWDEAKNISALQEIAAELPWRVCIAGETNHPDGNHVRTDRSSCYFLGSLDEATLRRWYACASIYALPAVYEPFGLTPLEAALSGCALVLGDIDSLREIWGDAATFVDPHDREELKTTLKHLIDNEPHREEMARRARARAVTMSSATMAEKYLHTYTQLLAKTIRRPEALAACA